jgi:hypothetical protein
VRILNNGVGEGATFAANTGGFSVQISENWHSGAPTANDPENYQVRLRYISGSPPDPGGPALSTWHDLDVSAIWEITVNASGPNGSFELAQAQWYVDIRRNDGVPEAEVTKVVELEASTEQIF